MARSWMRRAVWPTWLLLELTKDAWFSRTGFGAGFDAVGEECVGDAEFADDLALQLLGAVVEAVLEA